jgi:cupin 2 domain-containing protein
MEFGPLRNLFEFSEVPHGTETCETLLEKRNVTIERIVSSGTQPVASFLQDHDEWVLLVSGEAEMTVNGEHVLLKAGDTLHLPAGVAHEVLKTSAHALWLAVHVR